MFDTSPVVDCAGRPLRLDRPRVMGIVNVTPDSFSDGGRHFSTDAAIAHALALVEQGADILDIGGESTRPGAGQVSAQQEIERLLTSGQMSKEQFADLQKQAKDFVQFLK